MTSFSKVGRCGMASNMVSFAPACKHGDMEGPHDARHAAWQLAYCMRRCRLYARLGQHDVSRTIAMSGQVEGNPHERLACIHGRPTWQGRRHCIEDGRRWSQGMDGFLRRAFVPQGNNRLGLVRVDTESTEWKQLPCLVEAYRDTVTKEWRIIGRRTDKKRANPWMVVKDTIKAAADVITPVYGFCDCVL